MSIASLSPSRITALCTLARAIVKLQFIVTCSCRIRGAQTLRVKSCGTFGRPRMGMGSCRMWASTSVFFEIVAQHNESGLKLRPPFRNTKNG